MKNKKEININNDITVEEEKKIADQIFNRNDKNHPVNTDSGFRDILENFEPNISASSIFIKKVKL